MAYDTYNYSIHGLYQLETRMGPLQNLLTLFCSPFRICSPQDVPSLGKRPLVQGAYQHFSKILLYHFCNVVKNVQAPGRTGGENLSTLVKNVRNTAADSTHLVNSLITYSPNLEVNPFHCIRRNAGARTASSSIFAENLAHSARCRLGRHTI